MSYVLFCDSNSELWYEEAERYGLQVIQMPYIMEGKEYFYDLGKEFDFKAFYAKMREKVLPSTAALNQYDYVRYFEPVLESGKDILYITFSHRLSGTFAFMEEAIRDLEKKYPKRKITWFDSKGISMSCGIQVYYAAKLYSEGKDQDAILSFLKDFTNHIATYFVPDDLFHLKRGGRISSAKAAVGTLLGIKPLIWMSEDGALVNVAKIKGERKVISSLTDLIREKGDHFDRYDMWIMHADAENKAEQLKEEIQKLGLGINAHIQTVGPVIATHCGPGTLAVVFPSKCR